MEKEIQTPITPRLKIIEYYFPFLQKVDDNTRTKMTAAWGRINTSDYQFLSKLFSSRNLSVQLDNIAYLYNYFKFIDRVKKSDFNNEVVNLKKTEREFWLLFNMLKETNSLKRVSIVPKSNGETGEKPVPIKIVSEQGLKLFYTILIQSINNNLGMIYINNHLYEMQENGSLDGFLNSRSGNKIDATESVLRQSVTLLKNYLKREVQAVGKKRVPYNVITGEILNQIGLKESFKDDGRYNNTSDYYNKEADALNLDIMIPKTPKIIDDLFPPYFFIYFNQSLI